MLGLGVVGVELREGAPYGAEVSYGGVVTLAITVYIGALVAPTQRTARDKVYRLHYSAIVFSPCAWVVAPPLDVYSEGGVAHPRCASVGEAVAYG